MSTLLKKSRSPAPGQPRLADQLIRGTGGARSYRLLPELRDQAELGGRMAKGKTEQEGSGSFKGSVTSAVSREKITPAGSTARKNGIELRLRPATLVRRGPQWQPPFSLQEPRGLRRNLRWPRRQAVRPEASQVGGVPGEEIIAWLSTTLGLR